MRHNNQVNKTIIYKISFFLLAIGFSIIVLVGRSNTVDKHSVIFSGKQDKDSTYKIIDSVAKHILCFQRGEKWCNEINYNITIYCYIDSLSNIYCSGIETNSLNEEQKSIFLKTMNNNSIVKKCLTEIVRNDIVLSSGYSKSRIFGFVISKR